MKLCRKVLAVVPAVLMLAGCSEEPKPAEKAKEAKPAEPVTAMTAAFKMYTQARSWAPDVKILQVGSLTIQEVKNQGGKAAAWEATFVSESNQRSRRYTYSVVESPGSSLHEGVFGVAIDSWSAGGQQTPFLIQAFKTDSDAAYATALKDKKCAAYAAAHPDMPLFFLLEQTPRFPDPAWRVVWGQSVSASSLSVFVDAMTGLFQLTTN